MIRLLFVSIFLFSSIPGFTQTIYYSPEYSSKNVSAIDITKIEVSDFATIVSFVHTNEYTDGGWAEFSGNAYLKEVGGSRSYRFIKTEGIPVTPNKHYYSYKGEKLSFKVYFKRIDPSISKIDIIECLQNSCFSFFGVKLNKHEGNNAPKDFLIAPLEVGSTVNLNNVFFERGKAILLEGSYKELDKLVKLLKDNPTLKIELGGHADNLGDPKKDVILSEERVDVIMKYLIENGISSKRLTGKGYGGSKPIASNDTEDTRKLNRRVEFKIIGK